MTVGNVLFSRGTVSAIDSRDLVVRIHGCRSVGDGGVRSDMVAVCNTGRPAAAMIRQAEWRNNPAVKSAAEIWCVRDASKLAEIQPDASCKGAAHVSGLVLAKALSSMVGQ